MVFLVQKPWVGRMLRRVFRWSFRFSKRFGVLRFRRRNFVEGVLDLVLEGFRSLQDDS